ncbi:MAG: aminoacetone oxidase family FAD-binding enzyme, partial [Oscillospiraceae bacterium]|nr:aminoacetone oxidase family FAD-binding enzyme [Oscillospiraceae bacterium]
MGTTKCDVCVVGGGAAGMLAAGLLAERGSSVAVLEKNDRTLLKLGITGKGRCNLTNDSSPRDVISAVNANGRFLFSALNDFSPADTMAFFEGLGVPLKTERGGRVFPVSDRALDVVAALRDYVRKSGAKILRARASEILTDDGKVTGVLYEGGKLSCRAALLSTGGMSYPATGSTGDGYAMEEKLGHTIIPPRPSLVPLVSPDGFCREMQGLSLRNVTLRAYEGKKLVFEELGEMLFTHFGISGPLALSASAHLRDFSGDRCRVSIDLKPGLE